MNKLTLLLLSISFSLIITEAVVANLFQYPTYGVKCFVKELDPRSWDQSRVYESHSRYMAFEGESKGSVYKRNNLGLPGDDVDLRGKAINIAVIGSSFIEATQVDPGLISTSILQRRLRGIDPKINVFNLGYRGTNPFTIFRRYRYWEEIVGFDLVIVVIDHYPFQGTTSIADTYLPDEWAVDRNICHNLYRIARNKSAFINLVVPAIKKDNLAKVPSTGATHCVRPTFDLAQMADLLRVYYRGGDRLLIVDMVSNSMSAHVSLKEGLVELGGTYGIPVLPLGRMPRQYLLGGNGHYNLDGNLYLGSELTKWVSEFIIEF